MEVQRGLPYRRRLFAARHRKRSPVARLAKPFLAALFLVGSPAALAAWVLSSPEFTLREVEIEGAARVPREWVKNELASLYGYPMFEIPTELLEGRLTSHPWVAEARVRKRLPDQLRIDLVERRPAALLRRGGELVFVDAEGVAFAPFDPALGVTDLLLLSGGSDAEDLRAAMGVAVMMERVTPELARTLSEVEVLNHLDLRIYCAALPFPLVVSRDRLEEGLESLRDRLPEIEEHLDAVGAIDLRFERYIVIQPIGNSNSGKG
jgi:cell division septal protein FtsQ